MLAAPILQQRPNPCPVSAAAFSLSSLVPQGPVQLSELSTIVKLGYVVPLPRSGWVSLRVGHFLAGTFCPCCDDQEDTVPLAGVTLLMT